MTFRAFDSRASVERIYGMLTPTHLSAGAAVAYAYAKESDRENAGMRRSAFSVPWGLLIPLAAFPQGLSAQPALDDAQQLGMRLYNQSCVVCHAKPQITSGQYGPTLSKDSAGGRDDVMRDVISNGTPRMPGFKHQFEPTQISAIVAYLKTVPTPPPPPAAPAPAGR
jgi:mono/diheme cytochrome c family protein